MSARLEQYLREQENANVEIRRKIRVYRVAFSDLAAVSGVAVELVGTSKKLVTLRRIQISKPTVALTPYTLEKLSSASTGGTSTSPTPTPVLGSDGVADAVVKLYTSAPTSGTVLDQLQEIDIATGDVMNEAFGDDRDRSGAPKLENATETLVITVTVTSTVNGFIEWQEEP